MSTNPYDGRLEFVKGDAGWGARDNVTGIYLVDGSASLQQVSDLLQTFDWGAAIASFDQAAAAAATVAAVKAAGS